MEMSAFDGRGARAQKIDRRPSVACSLSGIAHVGMVPEAAASAAGTVWNQEIGGLNAADRQTVRAACDCRGTSPAEVLGTGAPGATAICANAPQAMPQQASAAPGQGMLPAGAICP